MTNLDLLAQDMGVTEQEFWPLWQKRWLLADGRVRPGTHFAGFCFAVGAVRDGREPGMNHAGR